MLNPVLSDIDYEAAYSKNHPIISHFPVILGLAFGLLSLGTWLISDGFRAIWVNVPLNLAFASILLSMTGGWLLPLTRSIEAEEKLLRDLLDRAYLDLMLIITRSELREEMSTRLSEEIVQTCRVQYERRRGTIIQAGLVATALKPVLLCALGSIALAFVQLVITQAGALIAFGLSTGFVTAAMMIIVFVFPSLGKATRL
jgi:hypothetical protein